MSVFIVPDGGVVYQVAAQEVSVRCEQFARTAFLMATCPNTPLDEIVRRYARLTDAAKASVCRSRTFVGSCIVSLAPEGWILEDRTNGDCIPFLTHGLAFAEASRREYDRSRTRKVRCLLEAVTNGTYCPDAEAVSERMMQKTGGFPDASL